MTDKDWGNPQLSCLGLLLAGEAIDEIDERGNKIVDDTLLILLNAQSKAVSFALPTFQPNMRWETVMDTREPTGRRTYKLMKEGETSYEVEAHSLALFRLRSVEEAREE
jgi:glycogen operon protein